MSINYNEQYIYINNNNTTAVVEKEADLNHISQIKQNLEGHYFDILNINLALLIGLVAFVYPKIFEIKERINNSQRLVSGKLGKDLDLKCYLSLISIFLGISLLLIFLNESWYISLLNIFIALYVTLYSYICYKKCDIYVFCPETIYKITKQSYPKIIFKKKITNYSLEYERNSNVYKQQLELLQDLAVDGIINNHNVSVITKYSNAVKDLFLDYCLNRATNTDDGKTIVECATTDKEKAIFNKNNEAYAKYSRRPLQILQYLNQIAIDNNRVEISYVIISSLLSLMDEYLKKYNYSGAFEIEQSIIDTCKYSLYYKIKKSKIDEWDVDNIYTYYHILGKANNDNKYSGVNSSLMRPSKHIFFLITKCIFRYPIEFDRIGQLLNLFQNSIIRSDYNFMKEDIIKLNCNILSYLFYKENYILLHEYFYNLEPKKNARWSRSFKIFPSTLNEVLYYYTCENSVMKYIEEFGGNVSARGFKLTTLILLLVNIKDQCDKIVNNNSFYFTQEDKDKKIECITDISKTLNEFQRKTFFLNIFNDIEIKCIKKKAEELFANKEFLEVFGIKDTEDYQNFVNEYLEKIQQAIIDGGDKLRTENLVEKIHKEYNISALKGYNDFDIFKLLNKPQEINKSKKDFKFAIEKSKFLIQEDNPKYFADNIILQNYRHIFSLLRDKARKINSISELLNLKLSRNFIIISNDSWYSIDRYKKAFNEEKLIFKNNNKHSIYGLKIGKRKLYFQKNNWCFSGDNSKNTTLLLLDLDKFNIIKYKYNKLSIKEKELSNKKKQQIRDNANSYYRQYSTDKEINFSQRFFVGLDTLENEAVGYSFTFNNENGTIL